MELKPSHGAFLEEFNENKTHELAPVDASAENIYIFGDRNGEITSLNNILTSQGHTVTTSQNLPADLSAFDNIWHVEATIAWNVQTQKCVEIPMTNNSQGSLIPRSWIDRWVRS